MIFTLGFIAYIVALVLDDYYDDESPLVMILGIGGFSAMLISLGMLAWRLLP